MTSTLTNRRLRFDAPGHSTPPEKSASQAAIEIEFIDSPTFPELDRELDALSVDQLCRREPVLTAERTVSFDNINTGLASYLTELRRTPLLSAEEEYELFRWMNYLKYRAAVAGGDFVEVEEWDAESTACRRVTTAAAGSHTTSQIRQLLRRAKEIRNRIVSANLRLVVSIAKKYVDRCNSLEDLISEGNFPLMRATEIFNFERGVKFSTYATWAIRNGLHRVTPRNRKRAARAVTGAEELLPNAEDERDTVRASEEYQREVQQTVEELLSQLEERDRRIVTDRFGINDDDREFRFREIAETLDISTERVRQLLARSLKNLREMSAELAVEVV